MEFLKRNKKNIVIVVLLILFLGSCATIFYLLKEKDQETKEITGLVIVADPSYVIIEKGKENYLISGIKGNYDIGDEVNFTYLEKDLNEKESPKKITIKEEELIKKANAKKEEDSSKIENTNQNENINTPNTNSDNKTNNNQNSNPSSNKTNISKNENVSSNADTEVLNYFNNLEKDFNTPNIKDSVKSGFTTVIDFLFYKGKIKGYTFSELSSTAKLKVLKAALYFDAKIEKYFPGYKESISNTTTKIYTNIKEQIVSTYLTLTTTICTNNEELCSEAKEGFNELKTNFGLTFDLIKEIAGDGITNLKSWYEIWRDK